MRDLTLIALGGAVGAVSRYLIGLWMHRLVPGTFPVGTLTVNVIGCLLLGLLMQLATSSEAVSPSVKATLGVGFLGALTTFSTFGYETIRCFERSVGSAALNTALNVVVGICGVLAGMLVARVVMGGS